MSALWRTSTTEIRRNWTCVPTFPPCAEPGMQLRTRFRSPTGTDVDGALIARAALQTKKGL